jgi:phage N-6-adenine-methyltransferase
MKPKLEVVASTDADAIEINKLHHEATSGSVLMAWKCGKELFKKKIEVKLDGLWIDWIKENLEFDERLVRRYIQLYVDNRTLASDIHPKDAIILLRKLWSHSNRTIGTGENEWYTPSQYVELARSVLGEIDLDPASCEVAQRAVKAKHFYTEKDNGLKQEWHGRIWMNPPFARGLIDQFMEKLLGELEADRVLSAIVLTHNFTDTGWFHRSAEIASAICFTRGRIKFINEEGSASPTNGQAFFYYGEDVEKFSKTFIDVGLVVHL